jgi:hypothetical protein
LSGMSYDKMLIDWLTCRLGWLVYLIFVYFYLF